MDDLYNRARMLIPGGTQLLSKRPEQFAPGQWPAYYRKAKGAIIEDINGRVFTDVSIHAVGACPLGYADEDVDAEVIAAIQSGSTSTLNAPEEIELAETLCRLHPWAHSVRYARGGGEAMAMAVRIARAATGKDHVAVCGYHGGHDWYLAANLSNPNALDEHLMPQVPVSGVPQGLNKSVTPFQLSEPETLERIVRSHPDSLAAIIFEPARYALAQKEDLEHARNLAQQVGAILIVDEITSAFRFHMGGAHLRIGFEPDMAVFAKAMSNGYPMAAVIGKRKFMNAAQNTFISSTSWSERIGPVAALATLNKLERCKVVPRLAVAGQRMRAGWAKAAKDSGLEIQTKGLEAMPRFSWVNLPEPLAVTTLYTQWMLEEGYLAGNAFYASYAHTDDLIDSAIAATQRVFHRIKKALEAGTVRDSLTGPIASPGLRREEEQV
jgi:glutamate-1-semialdehyde 2,1-aminomutase